MNDVDQSLQASFWLMIVMQTIGSVDMPGTGDRKLPAPRAYLATIVIWSVLQMAADAGYGRAARVSAWLIVLVGMVFGPFGQKVVDLFVRVADLSAPAPSSPSTPASPAPTTTRTGSPVRPVTQAPLHTGG